MSTRSVYVVGGPATGKSTFVRSVLTELGYLMAPTPHVLAEEKLGNTTARLYAHHLTHGSNFTRGVIFGVWKPSDVHPGTDRLTNGAGKVGEHWLNSGEPRPQRIIGEGQKLSSASFLGALHSHTDALLVRLWAPEAVIQERNAARGRADQNPQSIQANTTAARNRYNEWLEAGWPCLSVVSSDPVEIDTAIDLAAAWLK